MKSEEVGRISPPARGGARGGGSETVTTPPLPVQQAGRLPSYEGRKFTYVFLIAIALSIVYFFVYNRPCANFHEAMLQAPTQNISLALADTPKTQSRGLGGCTYIPKNSGMYFPFTPPQNVTFWMKDMVIPIDIIWIKNREVVGIEKNAKNEPLNTPDGLLKRYPSPGEIDAVLEIAADKAEKYGLVQGQKVTYPLLTK